MSVIIRLQNLPWSANALDVRTFFKGLSIPDGGVHIVGGEMGDAFIAFSTDEDARQAMMMSGGKIKEVQVSLLLSSRAEMQKVIEEARRTTLSFMQLSAQSIAATASPPAVAPPLPKVATVVPTTVAQQPQPPVISLSGFLAQNLNQQKAGGTPSLYSEIPGLGFLATGGGMFQPNAPAAGLFSALNSQTYGGGVVAGGANSAFTQLSEQLKKAAEAEKAAAAKSVGAAVVGGAVATVGTTQKRDSTSRRSRSSSRERDRRRSSRDRSRSRSRDRGRRRSGRDRSRSRSRDRRSRSRSRDRRRSRRSRSRDRRDSRDKDRSRDRDSKDKTKQRVSRFSDRSEGGSLGSPPAVDVRQGKVNPWDTPIQQNLLKLASGSVPKSAVVPPAIRSPNAGEFNVGQLAQPGYQTKTAVAPQVNYGSFEASKPISNEHLSKLQELHSRRDPRTFQNPQQQQQQQPSFGGGYGSDNIANNITSRLLTNKPNNYNSTGDAGGPPNQQHYRQQSSVYNDEMEGQSIKISNLETSTGYGEIRRFFSGQAISSNGIKMINDQNGKRTGVAYVRFLRKDAKRYAMSRNGQNMRRSTVKIESISDREFDDAIDSYQPGFDERRPYWVESYGGRGDKEKRDDNAGSGGDVIEIPDETTNERDNGKCGSLTIWNLPTGTTELDLMRIFSGFTIMEVLIIRNYKNPKQQDGYVKFCRLQDARRACESTHQHFIRNKRVFVKPCSDIEYDAAKNEYESPEVAEELEPEPTKEEQLDDSVQVVEDSIDSKKDEDDRMDLAEDDEEGQEEVVQNKISLEQDEPAIISDDDPPLDDPTPVQDKVEDDQSWEVEAQEPPQTQQPPPPTNFINRDPRNAFNSNVYQSPPPQHQPQPQQSPQLSGPPAPPSFNNFGGDFSRDPRRRQELNQRTDGGYQQQQQQGDNSRDSFDSRNSYNTGPPRFNSQGPTPPPMQHHQQQQQQQNRYDQQQHQMSDGNERTAFVLITNLEYSMREETVQDFLDREGFAPKKLQIIRNAYNRSMGECLVEFDSVQEAGESMIKNAAVIGSRKAFFKQLVRGQLPDMMMRINQHQRGPPQGGYGGNGGRFGGNGNGNFGGNYGRGGYGNNNFSNNNDFRGGNDRFNNNGNNGGGGNFQNSYQSQPDQFSNDDHPDQNDGSEQQKFDDQPDQHNISDENAPDDGGHDVHDQKDQNNEDHIVIHDDTDEHDHQPEPINSAESLPSHNGSNHSQHSQNGPGDESRPNQQQQHQQNQPPVRGSILSLANLPFRASNEEIVDFFADYHITLDDVKRRYLPDGRATGSAMVRFQSTEDAQQALQSHQQMKLGGRALRMWIMD